MAAIWVSNIGWGMAPRLWKISMSWRAAWKTLVTAVLASTRRNGSRSRPSAKGSMQWASSGVAAWIRHSMGQ